MKRRIKKLAFILLAAGLLIAAAHAQQIISYWIAGGLANTMTPQNVEVNANGRTVLFYKTAVNGIVYQPYASATVASNIFMINAYDIWPASLEVGATYYVATTKGSDGYGANPVPVTISGIGWDEVKGLTLVVDGGIVATSEAPSEPAPTIQIKFGNRLYQKALVAQGEKFYISDKPNIKVNLSIASPYSMGKLEAQSIIVDEGTSAVQTLTLTAANVLSTVKAASGDITAMDLSYAFKEENKLSAGAHTFTINAATSGTVLKATAVSEKAQVEVMGGPLQLIGTPICFPSPFSISKQHNVIVQYTLSADADIDIYLIGVSGQRIKRFPTFPAGTEGGSAGVNKVEWKGGVTDMGTLAGNGIYVGTIIAKEEGRLLGKFKLTIVD